MVDFSHMSEAGRRRELDPVEKTLRAVEIRALELRKTLTDDRACVSQAMRGLIKDNDPGRNRYFGIVMGRLARVPREAAPQLRLVQEKPPRLRGKKPTAVTPVPEKALDGQQWAEMLAKAKQALREVAHDQILAQAAEQEKLHPEDAYQNSEDSD